MNAFKDMEPQVIALGGIIASGKSKLVRTLNKAFGFPKENIISGDKLRKIMWAERDSAYRFPDALPVGAYDNPEFSDALAEKFIQNAKTIAENGGVALAHSGFTTSRMPKFMKEGVAPYPLVGIWLNADELVLRERLKLRSSFNNSHGSSRYEILEETLARKPVAPDGWYEIDTTHDSVSETAQIFVDRILGY